MHESLSAADTMVSHTICCTVQQHAQETDYTQGVCMQLALLILQLSDFIKCMTTTYTYAVQQVYSTIQSISVSLRLVNSVMITAIEINTKIMRIS